MVSKESINKSLHTIRNKLGDACLIAVTKYSNFEEIKLAYQCGQKDFGENKVQDLISKSEKCNYPDIKWHFIGHLQSNKVKQLLGVPHLVAIHSIDSIKLVKELIKRKKSFKGSSLKLFFQVNTSGEEEKSGFKSREELVEALKLAQQQLLDKTFLFAGLMTIGRIRTEHFEEDAKNCFEKMVDLKNDISTEFGKIKLSMGMSQDYELALKYGSDYIRVGSKIFKG
ncbi:MAG: YggS family pyridoxal phosphate-dependent enzyme [Bdellovibrionales bacterium]|nr:YggS family pyridoxal phosphate-dependent enzyme [Bdellovibrionales bacterium]